MTFEIEIDGRLHVVSVEPMSGAGRAGGCFRVTFGQPADSDAPASAGAVTLDVDARPTDLGLSLLYLDGARMVDAAITEQGRGACLVQLPHVDVQAIVDGRRFRREVSGGAAAGTQRIVAPMPGRVLRVLVQPGDEVAERQGLVVVEAMKMENELVALRAGRVREIAVEPGVSVEAGCLLVVVE